MNAMKVLLHAVAAGLVCAATTPSASAPGTYTKADAAGAGSTGVDRAPIHVGHGLRFQDARRRRCGTSPEQDNECEGSANGFH